MKHKLFSLLFAGIMSVLAVHAQTDYAKLGIERKVLFTMNKNEICTSVHTRNLQKGASHAKSEMYVEDTVKKITTYVLNGERIKSTSADVAYVYGSTYNDCMKRDSLILQYGKYSENEPSAYISFGNKVYGPYNWAAIAIEYYDFQLDWEDFFFGENCCPYDDYGEFIYIDPFRHDHDGMEYKMEEGKQGRTFFQSPNRKHTVNIMGNDIYKIRLDNTTYSLDSIKPNLPWYHDHPEKEMISEIKVYDDGNCIILYGLFYPIRFRSFGGYYIDKGKVRKIAENQYFDFESRTIKEKEQQQANESYLYRIEPDEREYILGVSSVRMHIYAEDTPEENAKIVENILKDHRLGYSIWDEKHQHQFFTVQGLGYVLVDGIAVKCDYPFKASLNTYVNAFRWVVVEGKDIVYYSYQLP